jgi:hypothetical protein
MSIKDDRKNLEKLIANSAETISTQPLLSEDIPEHTPNPAFDIDLKSVRKKCFKNAKKMIINATGLVLASNTIKENPYLKNKMDMDIISLSGVLYQLEINEMMQDALMEEVKAGAAHPRMFEVFFGLSKTISEQLKQLLQTVEAIKLTYRDIKIDIEDKNQELKAIGPGENGITRNKNGIITMGTKELINETKKLRMLQTQKKFKGEDDTIIDVEEIVR